jgi:hypothetical protein
MEKLTQPTGFEGVDSPYGQVPRQPASKEYLPVQKLVSAKWRIRLKEELTLGTRFNGWSPAMWEEYLAKRRVLSDNYDTVVSLDWPHFCSGATVGCGGNHGWCYTLGGQIGGSAKRSARAAITDRLARDYPHLFADIVSEEVGQLVKGGRLPYPNIRFSGSGEVHQSHLPALLALAQRRVHLWGFSRNIRIADHLTKEGISVLFSCDSTTPRQTVSEALRRGLKLAYTSTGVDDQPPLDAFVVFPLHCSGRVREIVVSESVCPKILEEYLEGRRKKAACQFNCTRCHMVRS